MDKTDEDLVFSPCGLPPWATKYDSDPKPSPSQDHATTYHNGTSSESCDMLPLFSLTSHASSIAQMEYNTRKDLLAMVTSLHELLMVKTAFVGHLLSQQSEGGEDMWEPSEEVTHVDTCPCKCEALQWIPWQQGTGVCVFLPEVKEARIYSLIQEKWVLLDTVATRDATVFSISPLYSIALAFAGGKLELLARQNPTSSGNVWQQTSLLEEDDVVETSGRARTGVKERYCMEWDSTGILLAVGSKEGRLRIFLVANSGTEFQSTVYMDDQFSQMGGITQVSWAPLLGRSFLILAVVSPSRVTLIVFRRSRHLLLGYKSSTSRSSSSRSSQLHLLTSTSITVSQALQLIWDPSTSNFTTTHADGTVCSWELNIRYTHAGSGAGAPSPSVEGPTQKKEKAPGQEGEPKLALHITATKVSAFHPGAGNV